MVFTQFPAVCLLPWITRPYTKPNLTASKKNTFLLALNPRFFFKCDCFVVYIQDLPIRFCNIVTACICSDNLDAFHCSSSGEFCQPQQTVPPTNEETNNLLFLRERDADNCSLQRSLFGQVFAIWLVNNVIYSKVIKLSCPVQNMYTVEYICTSVPCFTPLTNFWTFFRWLSKE